VSRAPLSQLLQLSPLLPLLPNPRALSCCPRPSADALRRPHERRAYCERVARVTTLAQSSCSTVIRAQISRVARLAGQRAFIGLYGHPRRSELPATQAGTGWRPLATVGRETNCNRIKSESYLLGAPLTHLRHWLIK
jgi:hypothetical protein